MDKEGMMRDAIRRTNLILAWCRTAMVMGVGAMLATNLTDEWVHDFFLWIIGGSVFVYAFAIGTMAVISLADLKADIAWDKHLREDRYR